ncbi:ROK family protein [Subtercola boreus]|uniref:Glucokinase n=1 Tax=Subtercola boreus TaxID=120213 RepID=A0A3E0WFP5_9MICO|nr:ROK family protein [Subtercola boreus]RFA22490.1 hypothetical protein B7R24_02345 [Subtercola boreus]RFA23260.1 hypothetical protein B7R23_02335 [Subtercola boreus]RFA29068.1 hypothetical protein B7R25_02350 [Subtercola boreus]
MTLPRRVSVADIGGSHITAAVVELAGSEATVVASAGRDTDPHGSADDILQAWAGACRTAAAKAGLPSRAPWGIAMPDPFDFERGTGTFDDVGKFEHLSGVDIRGELAARLGAQPSTVRFVHDAAAYGIGEWMFGAASGHDRAVCITLGTGVGSSFLDHGVPVHHRDDVPANGTVHLLEIAGMPLEESVSTRALVASYSARASETITVKAMAERARGGEAMAMEVLETAFFALGAALGPWLDAFEASVLVAGGSMSRSWDLLDTPFRAGVAEARPEVAEKIEITPSTLLDDAPLLGVAGWLGAGCRTARPGV